MPGDANAILRVYLAAQANLTAIVSTRIYGVQAIPEGCALPALHYFIRGGSSIKDKTIVTPSFQFDCWGNTPIQARSVYTALFGSLQGIGANYLPVVVSGTTYNILEATEEVQGQDLVDDLPNRYKVLAFFRIKMKID
jgi:hypothetical protein